MKQIQLLAGMCMTLAFIASAQAQQNAAGALHSPAEAFIPMEPVVAASDVEIAVGGTIVRTDIRLLTDVDQLKFLTTTRSATRIAKISENGKLSYLTGTLTGDRGKYAVFMDHASYFVEPIKRDNEEVGRYKTGVGLRLVASVNTKKRGIDLGSLLKIGLAVSRDEMSGSLEVVAFGVNSPQIQPLLPGIMSTIDESSIQKALESMAAVKAKFWDADTNISPSHFAVEFYEAPRADSITPPRISPASVSPTSSSP